jgi:hypothetical protein
MTFLMDMLIKLVSDYGVVFLILLGVGYGLFHYGKYRITQTLKDADDNNDQKDDDTAKLDNNANLLYHSLFANINHRLNNEIPTLELLPAKPTKQQMFRDILSIYTRTLFKTCKEIAELDMTDWSPEKWCDEINRRFNVNTYTFTNTCREYGVPEVVIMKFMRWHRPTQDIMFDGVMSLGNSNIFTSNIARTNTLFFMLNLLLVTTIADAEKTLKELNGDVHGKLYNGQVIEE